jgi:hypothetical protein
MRKVTLSCFDDKRHLLSDGITSYAYGHTNIAHNNEERGLVRMDPGVEEMDSVEVDPIDVVSEFHTTDKCMIIGQAQVKKAPKAKRVKTMCFVEDNDEYEVDVKMDKRWTPKMGMLVRKKCVIAEGQCYEVFDEPEIQKVPKAKRVKTMTFVDEVEDVVVRMEKHWTPELETVKKKKSKVSEGKCFEVYDKPEIRKVPKAKRVKTVVFEDEVEVKMDKRWTPELETVKKKKSKVSEGKCFEVYDKPEIRRVPRTKRAVRVTAVYDTEPDHSWVRDCSKYRKDPLKPPSLVEQHEEWVRFIREENNFNRLLKEEEDDYCEACEDENQSDSSDGEWFELQPIIRPIRTWEAQTVKRIRKRKPKKLTLWERRVKREIPGFTPLRA